MAEFKCEYTYSKPYGSEKHCWVCIGRHGAMHFHAYGPFLHLDSEWSGGLETHYREPPDYMTNDAPTHDHCHILKTPCWHDGTSSYAREQLIPDWLADRHNHDAVFDMLKREYRKTFKDKFKDNNNESV